MRVASWAVVLAMLTGSALAQTKPLRVVAAENFYGDVAAQIAGPDVPVTSILSNPDQDPHLFEASPSTARALADAGIVIANGVDYDPWINKLLRASPSPGRVVISAGELVKRRPGVNPHLWYDPVVMPLVAAAITQALSKADPAHKDAYAERLATFIASLKPIEAKIAAMRSRYAGQPVTATEPVFGYMATALGLVMRNERLQLAIMNSTEPRPSDVAAFEADLRGHRVRALLYNSQATGPAAQRLLGIARQVGIPVVGVTETEPGGTRFQDWMMQQLDALDTALASPR